MTLLFGSYKITSFIRGYKTSKAKGKQWQVLSYHGKLEDALKELFELRVRVDTKEYVVDFDDATNYKAQRADLIKKIEVIRDEMLGELK